MPHAAGGPTLSMGLPNVRSRMGVRGQLLEACGSGSSSALTRRSRRLRSEDAAFQSSPSLAQPRALTPMWTLLFPWPIWFIVAVMIYGLGRMIWSIRRRRNREKDAF